MKKGLLLFSATLLITGVLAPIGAKSVKADELSTAQQIKALITDYIGEGNYTKKTTIALTDETIAEMAQCFHCGLSQAKRTTYYATDKLLLANEDGSIPAGAGSYVFADGEVKRSAALEGTNGDNMWSNLSTSVSVGQLNATRLEDYYVTLNTFLADGYFDAWGKNNDTYYYDLSTEDKGKDANSIYNCGMWNDFLYFCAPMLYKNSGQYLSAKSLTIEEKYDANATKYLRLSMYLDGIDSGKVNESYFAQARIYKGNVVFEEDLSEGFFLKVWNTDEQEVQKIKAIANPNNDKEVMVNVDMNKGDHAKFWSTKRAYLSGDVYHNLTASVSSAKNSDSNRNYVATHTGSYNLYCRFTDSTLETYNDMYAQDLDVKKVYLQDDWNQSNIKMYYWSTNGDLSSPIYDERPSMVRVDSSNIYYITVPSCATSVKVTTDAKALEVALDGHNAVKFNWTQEKGDHLEPFDYVEE